MAAEIDNLLERKRHLLTRSEVYRHTLEEELSQIKAATAWVPRTVRLARASSPFLLLAAPFLGYLLVRRRPTPTPTPARPLSRGGKLLASALAGYRFFRQIKPIIDGVRGWRAEASHKM